MPRCQIFSVCVVLVFSAAVAGPVSAADQWIDLGSTTIGTPPTVDVLDVVGGKAVDVDLAGFYVEENTTTRGPLTVLEVPGFGNRGEIGEPALPFKTILIPLENGPSVDVSVLEADASVALSGVTVMPQQAPEPDCGDVFPEFAMDDKAYAADRWFPSESARLVDDVVVRGQRFLVVEVSPLAFNPVRGEIAARSSLRINIGVVGGVDAAAEDLKAARRSVFFPTVAEVEGMRAHESVPTGIEYLIIADDPLVGAVGPLADWKRLKGLTAEIVPMSMVGTTSADLKSYLQSRYNSDPDLTYVLLAGDHPAVPSESVSGKVTDLYYSCLDGSDYFPDVVIARIAVQTVTDCQNVVSKILAWDRNPVPGAWHGDYLMAAYLQGGCTAERYFFETGTHAMHFMRDNVGMGIHTAATSDSLSCSPYYWAPDFGYYNHRPPGYLGQPVPQADADLITNASTSTQDITDAINTGVSLVQHRDHGGITGWGDPPYSNSNVNGLNNGVMTPIVYSINCLTGTFDTSGDCFAEAFMKKYPGGAVGVMAATDVSYSGHNDLLVHGAYDSFWDTYDLADGGNIYPHSFRPAEAYLYGKYYMYYWQGDDSTTQLEFELFHWHGDPEMRAYTATPVLPSVSIDPILPVGSSTMTVVVDAENALVSVTDGSTLIGRGFVMGGAVVVDLAPPPNVPTDLDVVVSGHNLVPWQGTVEVIVPDGPWMAHRSHILDDSAGNGDGIANPGEAIVVPVTVENIGADDGSGITGLLSSGSGEVTVTDSASSFPDATVGALVQSLSDHFAIVVGAGAHNGDIANMTLAWAAVGGYAGNTVFSVPVCEALFISDVSVDFVGHDSATVSWSTNLPASSQVIYGVGTPSMVVDAPGTVTDHVVEVEGLDPCTGYVIEVSSASPYCYTASDNNGGAYYAVETAGWNVFFSETFDGDPGWTIDNGSEPTMGWAFGQPTGQAQDSYGAPDPTSGATGDTIYGVNLDGDIPSDLSENELTLTTPVIDLSDSTSAQLRYQRWLGVERDTYDNARVRLSIDSGASWSTVWENGGTTIDENAWSENVVELSAAAGQSEVQIQWTYGSTDGSWNYCGWNIDDVVVEGALPCGVMGAIFVDGFEVGDCGSWSREVP